MTYWFIPRTFNGDTPIIALQKLHMIDVDMWYQHRVIKHSGNETAYCLGRFLERGRDNRNLEKRIGTYLSGNAYVSTGTEASKAQR